MTEEVVLSNDLVEEDRDLLFDRYVFDRVGLGLSEIESNCITPLKGSVESESNSHVQLWIARIRRV